MKVQTKHFGEIELAEEKILHFDGGLPGFEDKKRFVLLADKEGAPFYWLQSLDDGNLAFVVTDPQLFTKGYDVVLPDWEAEKIGLEEVQDAVVFAIVTIPEDPAQMTANLLAPIIVNTKNRQGRQTILNDGSYSLRHPILEEMRRLREELNKTGAAYAVPGKGELLLAIPR